MDDVQEQPVDRQMEQGVDTPAEVEHSVTGSSTIQEALKLATDPTVGGPTEDRPLFFAHEEPEASEEPPVDAAASGDETAVSSQSADAGSQVQNQPQDFDPGLLQAALQVGLSVSDLATLEQMGGRTAVETAIVQKYHLQHPDQQQQSAPGAAAPPSFQKVELDPEEYDENIRGVVGTLQDQLQAVMAQNQELQQGFQRQQQFFDQWNQQQRHEAFNRQLSSLPESQQELVGRNSNALTPEQQQTRQRIWDEMEMRRNWANQTGRPMTEDSIRQQAVTAVLGQHAQQIARREVAASVRQRQMQSVQRPNNRGGMNLPPQNDEERAVANVAEWIRSHGP